MNDFLAFRTMITPVIIQIVFWIGVIVCVIAGALAIIGGANSPLGATTGTATGLLLLIVGPIVVRVYCELLMVLFRIHAAVESIAKSKPGIPLA